MYSVLLGVAGAILVMVIFAAGFFAGWRGKKAWSAHTQRAVVREISEKERARLQAEQEAFSGLMNYNAETAYGLQGSVLSGRDEE